MKTASKDNPFAALRAIEMIARFRGLLTTRPAGSRGSRSGSDGDGDNDDLADAAPGPAEPPGPDAFDLDASDPATDSDDAALDLPMPPALPDRVEPLLGPIEPVISPAIAERELAALLEQAKIETARYEEYYARYPGVSEDEADLYARTGIDPRVLVLGPAAAGPRDLKRAAESVPVPDIDFY